MDTLSLATFAPHVGHGFRARLTAERVVDLELVEVKPLGATSGGVVREAAGRQPFALYFKGPGALLLPQQIYRIEHDALGDRDIFIVPLGPKQGGMLYEAIFT